MLETLFIGFVAIIVISIIITVLIGFATNYSKLNNYKTKYPEIKDIITYKDVKRGLMLDSKNNTVYVINSATGRDLIKIPYDNLVRFKKEKNKFSNVVRIDTSLNDPNLSIINLPYSSSNILEIEKILTFAIGQGRGVKTFSD